MQPEAKNADDRFGAGGGSDTVVFDNAALEQIFAKSSEHASGRTTTRESQTK